MRPLGQAPGAAIARSASSTPLARVGTAIRVAGLAICSLCLAGGAPASAAAPSAPAVRFVEGPCKLPVAGVAMRCGEVMVPESRSGGSDRSIALGVQVVLAKRSPKQSDPIVLLGGGPGEVLTDKAASIAASPAMGDRDVILLDQRGVGLSRPALRCDGLDRDERMHGFMTRAERDRLLAICFRRYASVTDLSAFSTAESASDVIDVVRTLGYTSWNILGVSYGTRVGLTLMRMRPAGIRSVVLDSPYPPDINGFDAKPSFYFDQLDALLAGCAANAACAGAYPKLKSRVVAAMLALDHHPVRALVRAETGGSPRRVTVSLRLVLGQIHDAMYDGDGLRRIPSALDSLARGDYLNFFARLDGPPVANAPLQPAAGGFAEGMQRSVLCNDEQGWGGRPRPLASRWPSQLTDAFRYPYGREDCRVWHVASAARASHASVHSDLPALILVGEYDPITPPVLAQAAHAQLTNSRFVVMPGLGHAVTSTPCGQMLLAQFTADPSRPLDERCVDDARRTFHFLIAP
jgi:pimeloyl-ACP methyl ester carboxylesterase